MPDLEPTADPGRSTPGRVPSGALAATLHQQVAAILRVLDTARTDESLRAAPSGRVLEKYQPSLQAAMLALGETLAGFLAEGGPVDLDALRSQFLEPVLAISRSLPVFRRAESWVKNQGEIEELHRLLLEGRPGGFDIPTLLLDDFYQHRAGAESLRSRASALMRSIGAEIESRGGLEGRVLRILVLGANSILALRPAATNHGWPGEMSLLIVDGETQALRRARQHVEATLKTRPAVLRADPLTLAAHPSRPPELFDLVYTLSRYDTLSFEAAIGFTQGIASFLKPGAALMTGSYLDTLPRSHRALAVAFVGMHWTYCDEGTWRKMLSDLPFDLEASRFEIQPPATLIVAARRLPARGPHDRS